MDTSRFKSWHAVLARYAHERENDLTQSSEFRLWMRFLDGIRGATPRQQLVAVNRFMNSRRYESDTRNWGVKDYWASPAEFLARAAGDCEDFVIAKYLSLTALGWNEDQLRFVAVKDLRTGMDHAILVAFHNGQALVLDNNSQSIKYAEELSYYRPIYSINSTSWWLHRAGFPA
ncbi:MAG: transglutaminase-like cysteine peptidase [Rhodospirillales bacterium]|nr:transglutaminase-like cysteine peptidase [Rhodospirillales bacterium]